VRLPAKSGTWHLIAGLNNGREVGSTSLRLKDKAVFLSTFFETRAKRRLYLSSARERSLFGTRGYNLPSRFLSEIPDELVERQVAETAQSGWSLGGTGGGLSGPISAPQPHAPVELAVGDDVVHASFGDGVVTAVEPGSVVVVRFARDGAERKLMADYAPLRKAS
jgi:DNA helicase-2/ATP-dependent DNA helicase PcrA